MATGSWINYDGFTLTTTANSYVLAPLPSVTDSAKEAFDADVKRTRDYLTSRNKEEEKDTNMYQYDDVQAAKQRLKDRVNSVSGYDTDDKLQKKFGLRDDDLPKTADEFLQRVKESKIVVPSKEDAKYHDQYDLWGIRFRDPDLKEDTDGYKEARTELKEHTIKAIDEIMVYAPAEGLKSLQKFEKFVKELVN